MFKQLIGQSLDRYQMVSQLGEGELGAVFKAHDPTLQRDVAVKVIDARRMPVPGAAEAVLQQARHAARLDHPGLVHVHDFGRSDGLLYIVMEFIPGGNLRELLQDLRSANQWLLLSEAVALIRQVCLVLDYLNRQGESQRRVRPSDIMLKPEPVEGLPYRPVLTDLGLALVRQGNWQPPDGSDARPGYAYWSPEQALGEPLDSRSQVYSLGVLLYELAVGWQPFPANSLSDAVRAHTREAVPPPRTRRADLPAPLEGVILKCLSKAPDERYADPAALAEALQDMLPLAREAEAQASGSWAVSLLVPYQRSLQETAPPAPPPIQPAPRADETVAGHGRLKVVPPNAETRYFTLRGRAAIIGRHPDSDLVLDDPAVSAQHARVEFDGQDYRLTDLNSQAGTHLGGLRLLPGVPEIWRPGTPALVGDTWLHLEPGQAAARRSLFRFDGITVDASQIQTSPNGRVGVYVEVPQLTVTPGQRATAGVVVVNQGHDVDRFYLSVDGVPMSWLAAPMPPSSVQLPPGGFQRLKIVIEPPRAPQSRAGRYTLTVRAASHDAPDQVVTAKVSLAVSAFAQFRTELSAATLTVNQPAQLVVHNQGNTQEAYTVQFEDPAGELVFDPPAATVTVPEGQTAVMDFSVAVQRPRLIGSRRSHPFTARVTAPGGQSQTHSAELLSSALVPPWVPLLFVLMGCLLASVALFAYNDFQNRAQATETAAARQTTDAIALADSDGDGLSNADEVRLGTNALNPDTDGDGLNDGDEVTWGANPLVADSDGDTLPDGREVHELGTSPINPDTDGDGLNDNVDPDPGQLPTPTASATFTLEPPTETQTAPPPTETPTPPPATDTLTPEPATNTPEATATTAASATVAPTATSGEVTPTTGPGPAPGQGFILFESRRDGHPEVYIMNADGSSQARLTNNTPDDSSESAPSWSSARQQVAFQSDREGNFDIFIMNADGSGQTQLTEDAADDTSPVWAPNGSLIAFISNRDGNAEIYTVTPDGNNESRLTDAAGDDGQMSWSPDSTRIAFVSERDGNAEIYVMDANGDNVMRLTNNSADDTNPVWSPNGNWIAFVSERDGNAEIYLMSSDGTGQLRLTNNAAADTSPVWAPNSARLAFVSERDGNQEIYAMLADGSAQTRLTNNAAVDAGPVWSPAGDWLAFRSERDGNAEVYVISEGGSGPTRLTNNDAYDAPVIWRP